MIESIIRSAIATAKEVMPFFTETDCIGLVNGEAEVIRSAGVSVLDNLENLRAIADKAAKVASPTMAAVYNSLIYEIEEVLYPLDRAIIRWYDSW